MKRPNISYELEMSGFTPEELWECYKEGAISYQEVKNTVQWNHLLESSDKRLRDLVEISVVPTTLRGLI